MTQHHRGERLITAIFVLLGVGVLLPWNAFISAKAYFQARLCSQQDGDADNNNDKNNSMNSNVELWFGLVFNLASVCSLGSIILVKWIRDRQRRREDRATKRNSQAEQETLTSKKDNDGRAHVVATDHLVQVDEQEEAGASSSPSFEGNNSWSMVLVPLSVYLAVFTFTTLLVLLPSISSSKFLAMTLVGLAICGVSCAIGGAGIIATAGMFPPKIGLNSYFSGQAVGGVAVSVANLMAASFEDPASYWKENCGDDGRILEAQDENNQTCIPYRQVDLATFMYFSLGCLVLGACIVGYIYIDRSDTAKNLRRHSQFEPLESVLSEDNLDQRYHSPSPGIELRDEPLSHRIQTTEESEQYQENERNDSITQPQGTFISSPEEIQSTASVWKAVDCPGVAIFLTLFVTLSIFPSWTSRLESVRRCRSHHRLYNDLFLPMTFVIFNVGDLAGRLLSAKIAIEQIQNLSKKLVLAALLRFLFHPLFLLCFSTDSAFQQVAIRSDAVSILVQFACAVTNGMLLSISFMYAPSLIPCNASVQDTAATLLNFCLVFGLLCGSFCSFPYDQIATGRW